jgi:sigma-B regulation protein RsbU (phosphoserine phosphatase)
VLDPATRTLTYARAGHNPPRLARGEAVESLDRAGGLPLGILEEQAYCQTTVTLEPGDLLLLYTDGITEAMAPSHGAGGRELFGTDRLDAVLLRRGHGDAEACLDAVRSAVADFCGCGVPTDDQTLIALRCV